jgi:hypothetical protein
VSWRLGKCQSWNSKRFAALEYLNNREYINRVWENIEYNVKTSAKKDLSICECEQHKLCFEGSSRILDQRKQAKMQWLWNLHQSNFDYLNSVRRKTNRYVRENTEYLKGNIDELKTNNNIRNIRDLYSGINHLRRVTSLELLGYRMRRVILLQTSTVISICGEIISLNCPVYMELVILGRQKYIQLKH